MATLLDECIEALGENIVVFEGKEKEKILDSFENSFPITSWARIDWDKFCDFQNIVYLDDIEAYLNKQYSLDSYIIYIIWDEASLPIIKTNLHQILQVIDDVTAVSFDTWLYSPNLGYAIEFYHEGEVRIGNKKEILE
ncbi:MULTISPECIES: CDI toxin immunity protein [unclassified Bacillus (in: firmicutes)]|uniref:CDI toxin immunity protein n=1 Tax=unclassified Bacillus (in: firmicutes) TaxID=185979 RepID=UPI00300F8DB3